MTGIVASLTPDYRERKEHNNCISHVHMLWTPSLVSKSCGLHLFRVYAVDSIYIN